MLKQGNRMNGIPAFIGRIFIAPTGLGPLFARLPHAEARG